MTEQLKVVGRIIKVSKAGWGFISSKEIEFTRIFFHWTALTQSTMNFTELRSGMMVEFIPLRVPDKGWRAVHVCVLERTNVPVSDGEVSTLHELGPADDRVDAS